MRHDDFFKKTNLLLLEGRMDYIKYMDVILENQYFKTILFYDEFDTKIIRMHWNPNKEERMDYKEMSQTLNIDRTLLVKRFNEIYLSFAMQMNITHKYYEKHKFPDSFINKFKRNIETVMIDKKIKEFIIKNNFNTLEQLLIGNSTNWGANSIRDIRFITDYFESRKIEFNSKSSIQVAVQKLELTEEELNSLEQLNIITYNDLISVDYNELKYMNLPEILKEKIKTTIGLTFEKRGIFKKVNIEVDDSNIAYMDYLEKILYDDNYKTFLFFDKKDIELLRTYYDNHGNVRILQKDLPELLGISLYEIRVRLNKIYLKITEQIQRTHRFYKNNKMSLEQVDFFKKNIEDIEIDSELKKLIIEHNLDNLEQYIILNPIRWDKQTLRMIKKSLDFYKQNKIGYDNVSKEQAIMYHLNLSYEEIRELLNTSRTKLRDLSVIMPNTLKKLNISEESKQRIAQTFKIKYSSETKIEKTHEIKKGPSGYKEFLKIILQDKSYKTFLFLDEIETEILRMYHNEKLKPEQISKKLEVEESKINKILENLSRKIPEQIEETYSYYKDNHMSQKMINRFKLNIEDIEIDEKIKKFVLSNNLNTLEQLLINNPIDWSKQQIRMIKEIPEYFEKKGINFKRKDATQKLFEKMGITKNEVNVLEQNNIIYLEQIEALDLDELEETLKKLPVLIRKLRRNLNLNATEKTSIEALKIRYWTGQKIIKSGFKTIGDLTNSTRIKIKRKCDLSRGELKELEFRMSELGFELKKDKQYKKMP